MKEALVLEEEGNTCWLSEVIAESLCLILSGRGISSQPSTKSPSGTLGSLVPVKDKKNDFQDLANAEKEFDDEEDEDFDVKLDEPEPQDEASHLQLSSCTQLLGWWSVLSRSQTLCTSYLIVGKASRVMEMNGWVSRSDKVLQDDLDLKLDDTDGAQAPFKGIPAVNSAEKPFRPSTFTAVRSNSQSGVPGIPAAVPGIPAGRLSYTTLFLFLKLH